MCTEQGADRPAGADRPPSADRGDDRPAADERYPAAMAAAAAHYLSTAPTGTRVVARYRIPGGFTDALGYLRSRDDGKCNIETRRGIVVVALVNVVAAKKVPEPPPRRSGVRQQSD